MLHRASIVGRCVSAQAASKGFARFLFFVICIHLSFLGIAGAAPASAQWKAASGMTATQVNGVGLKLSGTQSNSWVYATAVLPFPKLEPGATYRLEGWMRIEALSDYHYLPTFKLVVGDAGGKWIGDFTTFVYAMSNRNTRQKLWVEFTADDRFSMGSLAVDKGGTNKALTAILYIRGVALTKIAAGVTYPSETFVPDEKLHDVFWPFKKSSVIAFMQGTFADYRDYGVNFVSWGGHPEPGRSSVAAFCKRIDDAAQAGTSVGANIDMRNNFVGFIKTRPRVDVLSAACRDLEGNPILVEEMSFVRGQGMMPYLLSTNNNLFRQYLKDGAERAMQCKPRGLMIDAPLGDTAAVLWYEGEYSDNSVIGFRKYLKAQLTPPELLNKGISDIDTFDIREYHRAYVGAPKEKRPLRKEMIDFQISAAAENFHEIRSTALKKLGQRAPVSANISPASIYAGRLFMDVDYFSFECQMKASSGLPNGGDSALAYKMADALKRPAVAMGTGYDHAFVQDNHLPGMIRYWIAEAYALGNYFMAPYDLWAYSSSRGTYSYKPRNNKELAPMYQFIKNHAYLFDDYQVVARTALILGYASYVQGRTDISGIVKSLITQNTPFEIAIAGNDVLGIHLSASQLSTYDNLIIPAGSILSTDDSNVLQNMKDRGKTIVRDINNLDQFSRIGISGVSDVRATLRTAKSDNEKTAVIHLLNGSYDMKKDAYAQKRKFVINIPRKLLKNPDIKQVDYIRPPSWTGNGSEDLIEYPDTSLEFRLSGDIMEVTVPHLDMWGILKII